MKSLQNRKDWPLPKYDECNQPHFLFIISPPSSGSTALSQLLNTSHRTMLLEKHGEGQWLLPGMCEKGRWSPEKEINYSSVKAVWLSKYQEVNRLVQNIDVVIEGSHPNMMRLEKLTSQFRDYSFIASNRDPYANCSCILHRYNNADNLGIEQRKEILSSITIGWLMRSSKIRELIPILNAPLLTYENFCKAPSSVLNILNLPSGVSQTINPNSKVVVNNSIPQPIVNQNKGLISKLSNEEIEHISRLLTSSKDLLEYFGYGCLEGKYNK